MEKKNLGIVGFDLKRVVFEVVEEYSSTEGWPNKTMMMGVYIDDSSGLATQTFPSLAEFRIHPQGQIISLVIIIRNTYLISTYDFGTC